jgi:glycerol-3-phosphate dehydrogenase
LNARPRETHLITDRLQAPGLISIYGGKLTAYRATTQRVLGLLASSLPRQIFDTRGIRLSASSWPHLHAPSAREA